jgi:hypothetical protein
LFDSRWDEERESGDATFLAGPGGGPVDLVQWSRGAGEFFTGVVQDGELVAVFTSRSQGVSVRIATWLPNGMAVGNANVPPSMVPGSTVTGASASDAIPLPALIDIETGTITPLLLFGPLFNGTSVSSAYLRRNHVLSATTPEDTLYRVSAPSDCLYVRDRPDIEAARLNCLADGAIVTAPGKGTVEAGGYTWASVSTIDGQQGWASLEYLRRE